MEYPLIFIVFGWIFHEISISAKVRCY